MKNQNPNEFKVFVLSSEHKSLFHFYDLKEMNKEVKKLQADGHIIETLNYHVRTDNEDLRYIFQLRFKLNPDKRSSFISLVNRNKKRYMERKANNG